ncbi:MAG: hypothetical protein RL033_5748 [Pseudomonadota bacterium]|jgi:hypothetical protein
MPLSQVVCGSALFIALLLCGGRAVAEESEAARLFQEGRALLVEERFAEACSRLEQSQQLEPRLGTKLNIAFCQERLGKLATAWRVFQEALSSARAEGDVAREAFAKSRIDALSPRLPSLKVRAAADAGQLTLLLDGAALGSAQWNTELPVDPGAHTLVAAYIGEPYWRRTVTLRESEHVDIAIPAAPEETGPRAAGKHTTSRFVYEIGAFIGYLNVDTRLSTPEDSPSQTVSDDEGTTRTLNCYSSSCDYDSLGATSGFVIGAAGFVGYAIAPDTQLGLRSLVGLRAGGGILAALGPTASLRLSERFRVGPTLLFGTASHTDSGFSQLRDGNDTYNIYSRMNGTLQLAIGLGAELDYELLSSPTGSVLLQATPLLLYGDNGVAFSLPVGVAYRWN